MISVKEFMECINYRITEGSEYLWRCYGDTVYQLESTTPDFTICVVIDARTQFVYEMEVWDYLKDRTYRWISPNHVKTVKREHKARGLKFKRCIDDRKYIDIDVPADILEKATAIAAGEEYDPRIMVELSMTNPEMFSAMQAAHASDLTFNQYVNQILEDYIMNGDSSRSIP